MAVTIPLFLQSKEEGASSQDWTFSCMLPLKRVLLILLTGFFTFDMYICLNSSLLISANLFNPNRCALGDADADDLLFAFVSIMYFKFRRKFSNLFSASSACLYTRLCSSFHRWNSSITRSSEGKSATSCPSIEYSLGRPNDRHVSEAQIEKRIAS